MSRFCQSLIQSSCAPASALALALLLVAGAAEVVAQTGTQEDTGGIPIGAVTVYPSIGLQVVHDDNLFSSPTDEIAVWNSIVSPSLKIEAKGGSRVYSLTLGSDIGRFDRGSDDDYEDYRAIAEAAQLHDPRGTGATEGDPGAVTDPDEYREFAAGALYSFGADDAFARLEGEVERRAKRYINNRDATAVRDRDDTSLRGAFFYQVMPNTSLIAELSYTDIAYRQESDPGVDSAETAVLLGVTWQATFQTSGTFKFGRLEKDFDDDSPGDFSDNVWDLSVQWRPVSFSTFDFSTSRTTGEKNSEEDFILTDRYSASWTHGWLDRLSTTINMSFAQDEFVGAGITRADDLFDFGARVDYQFRKWLSFGAGYAYSEKDSNEDIFNFQRNQWSLNLDASF